MRRCEVLSASLIARCPLKRHSATETTCVCVFNCPNCKLALWQHAAGPVIQTTPSSSSFSPTLASIFQFLLLHSHPQLWRPWCWWLSYQLSGSLRKCFFICLFKSLYHAGCFYCWSTTVWTLLQWIIHIWIIPMWTVAVWTVIFWTILDWTPHLKYQKGNCFQICHEFSSGNQTSLFQQAANYASTTSWTYTHIWGIFFQVCWTETKCRGIDVLQSRIGIIISNIRLIEWKQSTKLRWSAFLNLKLWVSQRKDQLFFFFTGIIGDYKGLQSLLSRLGRLSRLNSKLVKVWYQKSWHYSCCDNDNNDDHNNSHYNISDWMRIKLFDECLGADRNMCHQRQYSLLVKIFQKVVFVLSYIWKHASVKSSFPSHSVRHPFHPSSELLPPDVKKIWSSQFHYQYPNTR